MEEALKELKKASSALRARQANREKLVTDDDCLRAGLAQIEAVERRLSELQKQRAQHLAEATASGKAFDVVEIDKKIAVARKEIEQTADTKVGLIGSLEIWRKKLKECDDDIEAAQQAFDDAAGDVCLSAYAAARQAFENARAEMRRSVIAMAAANDAGSRFRDIGMRDDFQGVCNLADTPFPFDGWLTEIDKIAKPGVASLLETIEATR